MKNLNFKFCKYCRQPKHKLMVGLLPTGEVTILCKDCDERIERLWYQLNNYNQNKWNK